MIQRPFFNLGKRPRLPYPTLPADAALSGPEAPVPETVFLLYQDPGVSGGGLSIKPGDQVRTGQRLSLRSGGPAPLVVTVTGRIAEVSTRKGDMGKDILSIRIDAAPREEQDGELARILKGGSPQELLGFLESIPGMPPLSHLLPNGGPGRTLVISGMDQDLLITSNQLLLRTQTEALAEGIKALKEMIRPSRIILAVPPGSVSAAEQTGAEVVVLPPYYPNGHPRLVVKEALKQAVPMTKTLEAAGILFLGVDDVLAIHPALMRGEVPTHRVITVVNKEMQAVHVRVRVGTPVIKVLEHLKVETVDGDRVVIGGPMTGRAIAAQDQPVSFDTKGIVVQDRTQIIPASDTHCINCGDCVRACPARIPVNVLIRFLENRLYQDAVDACDLLYCIECGLCAYVCPARIPVFHYIALGKYEFARQMEEAAHA